MELDRPKVHTIPEVVDDFVRNFLVRTGMKKTLDTFQCEWYELQMKGLIKEENITEVPDCYTQNSILETEVGTAFSLFVIYLHHIDSRL